MEPSFHEKGHIISRRDGPWTPHFEILEWRVSYRLSFITVTGKAKHTDAFTTVRVPHQSLSINKDTTIKTNFERTTHRLDSNFSSSHFFHFSFNVNSIFSHTQTHHETRINIPTSDYNCIIFISKNNRIFLISPLAQDLTSPQRPYWTSNINCTDYFDTFYHINMQKMSRKKCHILFGRREIILFFCSANTYSCQSFSLLSLIKNWLLKLYHYNT